MSAQVTVEIQVNEGRGHLSTNLKTHDVDVAIQTLQTIKARHIDSASFSDDIKVGDTVAYRTLVEGESEWRAFTVRAMDEEFLYENPDKTGDNIARGACFICVNVRNRKD